MGYFLLGLSSTKHYEKTSVITSDSLDFHRANSYTNRGNIWNRLYSFLNKLHFMSLHRNFFEYEMFVPSALESRSETCSNSSIKTLARNHSVEFIVYIEHIPHLVLVYILLTLNR